MRDESWWVNTSSWRQSWNPLTEILRSFQRYQALSQSSRAGTNSKCNLVSASLHCSSLTVPHIKCLHSSPCLRICSLKGTKPRFFLTLGVTWKTEISLVFSLLCVSLLFLDASPFFFIIKVLTFYQNAIRYAAFFQ